ncbi:MAG: hypothetical protein ACI4U4_01940 [Bacilli bacterium]
MKKYSNLIVVIISFTIFILILFNKELVSSTIINSFYIWFNTLVPSMLPMFILSDILINYNFIMFIPNKITSFISKLFNISKEAVLVVFISLISGFPGNALAIKTAYDLKLISKDEANHLLLFTHFANPLFILQTIGIFYLKNNTYGIIVFVSHILSGFILGILFRNNNSPSKNNYISKNNKSQSFTNVFSLSIKKSINTLLMVSGTVTSFLIISTLISNIFNLNQYMSVLVQGILEMTMGLSNLSILDINNIYKVIFSSGLISFGGLSIHMQVMSILDDFKYFNYFKGRICHALLAMVISFLIFITLY